MKLPFAVLFCLLSNTLLGASFTNDFAVVFIDAAAEAKYGAFPIDRTLEAKAIRQAAALGAKGVVMKFFFDQPKDTAGDFALGKAMTNLPVVLQACLDDSEAQPNPLAARFTVPGTRSITGMSGRRGFLPLPLFAAKASDVGFVDFFDSTRVPLLETYQTNTVKSLIVCCMELATGSHATFSADGNLTLGTNHLHLEKQCCEARMPAKDDLAYIPFDDFLSGKVPADAIKGKVVIIGYDGSSIQSVYSAIGPIKAHRYFVYALKSVYEQISH